MIPPSITPALVALDEAPLDVVLACAAAGLRALGSHSHAEVIEWAHRRQVDAEALEWAHRRRRDRDHFAKVVHEAILAAEACLALANQMDARQWASAAFETVRHLRALERRTR